MDAELYLSECAIVMCIHDQQKNYFNGNLTVENGDWEDVLGI